MFNHPITEHLPKQIATELRQRGVDEQPRMGFSTLIRKTQKFYNYIMLWRLSVEITFSISGHFHGFPPHVSKISLHVNQIIIRLPRVRIKIKEVMEILPRIRRESTSHSLLIQSLTGAYSNRAA